VEVDNSQTLLNDVDQCESLAGPKPADVVTTAIRQDVQATNDDLVDRLSAENVRIPLTKCT